VALATVPFLASAGQAAAASTTLRPTADAWYATSPACAQLPLGCGSSPTTTSYPDGTLHLGATGGQEAARVYLAFSTAELAGADLVSASLVLPIDAEAGTNAPETSAVTVCLVPGRLPTPTPSTAPPVDCSVSSVGSYLPGPPATVEVDLAPFASRLRSGSLALAVIPTPVTATSAVTDTWSLALSDRQRTGSSVPAPSVQLSYVRASSSPSEPAVDLPPIVPPLGSPPAAPVPVTQPLSAPQPPLAVATPPVVAVAPQPAGQLVRASFTIKGGRYGTVWAVPLLLFLLGWGIRAVGTRDLRSYAS
jgi:hypothetical protein